MDYSQSKIYMISPTLEFYDEGDVYIGSTTQSLDRRLTYHMNNPFNDKTRNCSSSLLVNKYSRENLKIELICDFPCKNKTELNNREGQEIKKQKCLNIRVEGRKPYQYREDNRALLLEKQHKYLKDNRKKVLEYQKSRREKVNCECGVKLTKSCLFRHKKNSIAHKVFMENYYMENI
jgi:hypothetical protein